MRSSITNSTHRLEPDCVSTARVRHSIDWACTSSLLIENDVVLLMLQHISHDSRELLYLPMAVFSNTEDELGWLLKSKKDVSALPR